MVAAVLRRLLFNFIMRPRVPFNGSNYPVFPEGSQPGVLQRVSSAAGMVISSFSVYFQILLMSFHSSQNTVPLEKLHCLHSHAIFVTKMLSLT